MSSYRPLGISSDKAWVAGWDASITGQSNPYKRRDYARHFQRGREAGVRSNDADVDQLKRRLARLNKIGK